jgi:peptidoglycan-associated lipoprotein
MKRNLFLAMAVAAVLVTGSKSTRNTGTSDLPPPPASVESKAAATADTGAIASAGVVGDDASNEVGLPAELVNKRVIYFAFDSSEIRAEDRALVAAHAKFLAGRGDVGVRLRRSHGPARRARIQHRSRRASCTSGARCTRPAGRQR